MAAAGGAMTAVTVRGGGREGKKPKQKKGGWPHVSHKPDLQITPLKGNFLFTVPNFLSSSESKAFVEAAESIGFAHQGSLGPTRGEAYRDNDRISVNDPVLAESLWESGLRRLFSDIKVRGRNAIGLNPNIRFYRYKVGQRFGGHIDESVDLEGGCFTQYTLLVYLNGQSFSKTRNDSHSNEDLSMAPLAGGETVFYDKRKVVAEVAPVEGMALLHIHGDMCLLHEARVVTKNIKYILRSDVVFS